MKIQLHPQNINSFCIQENDSETNIQLDNSGHTLLRSTSTENNEPSLSESSLITYEWTLFTEAVDRLIFIIFTVAYLAILIEIARFPFLWEHVQESKIVDVYSFDKDGDGSFNLY